MKTSKKLDAPQPIAHMLSELGQALQGRPPADHETPFLVKCVAASEAEIAELASLIEQLTARRSEAEAIRSQLELELQDRFPKGRTFVVGRTVITLPERHSVCRAGVLDADVIE